MHHVSAIFVMFFLMAVSSTVHGGQGTKSPLERKNVVLCGSALDAYSGLNELKGLWRGVGEGKWGTSEAEKRFASILDGKAICRDGRSVYPKQESNPAGETHLSHSLFSLTEEGTVLSLSEYDNEGFIAHYALDLATSVANRSWVFELVEGDNLPPNFSARLTLSSTEKDQYTETFELDFSGKGYVTYLINRFSRASDQLAPGCGVYLAD
ncbi:hypothetical protein [Shewanella atlantica]|uniref:hypothetical protein n=2 Tax=Shewanella TaxID=22 RepID=UPI003735530B